MIVSVVGDGKDEGESGKMSRFFIWTVKRARLICLGFRQIASEDSI